ncbi:MAG: cytochrome P450 [Lewinella sp.]|uniref:cytochrome P450 n=1 Tax=Lewinella sp. TaxID=2004506 RepID=UPI003D6BD54B
MYHPCLSSYLCYRFLTKVKGGCPAHYQHTPELIRAFGGGPRFCPGKHLATYEMVAVVSALCCNFDISLMGKPEEVKEGFAFTMHPENLKIRLGTNMSHSKF